MIIYRVYHPFRDPSDSGIAEYGFFSSIDKARERLKQVFNELDQFQQPFVQWNDDKTCFVVKDWNYSEYLIEKIEVKE